MPKEQSHREENSLTVSAIRAMAISPEKAMKLANQYKAAARKSNPQVNDAQIEEIVSKKVIDKYSRWTSLSGAVCALPGAIPGVGTAVAMVGGGAGDAYVSLKSQIDMTMILAANYGWDLTEVDAQYMAMLIAVSCGLEKLGVSRGVPVASKAGIKLLQQYLTGATLKTVKQIFSKFGVTFTRTSLEKAFPFGIGVVAGSSLNYALTRYVGWEAVKCFNIERSMKIVGEGFTIEPD